MNDLRESRLSDKKITMWWFVLYVLTVVNTQPIIIVVVEASDLYEPFAVNERTRVRRRGTMAPDVLKPAV